MGEQAIGKWQLILLSLMGAGIVFTNYYGVYILNFELTRI
jgi:hypothetical protein